MSKIVKRNLLCIQQKEKLDIGKRLLYEPYKNILIEFVKLMLSVEAKDFDPVAKVYDGLLSAPAEIKEYYESLLGITSYYQHSQGGKGKYIEKKIASAFETCSLDITLSDFPIWLEHPQLHRKKGIFTLQGIDSKEKKVFRTSDWNWIGKKDENSDVGNILVKEKTIVLMEIKNRVDSGGVAGRREIWTSQKFGVIVDYLLQNEKLYEKGNHKFSFAEILETFGFNTLELYIGVLFDKGDRPATVENDRKNGFYSSSKEGFIYLRDKIKNNPSAKITSENLETLEIKLIINNKLKLTLSALYGDDVTQKLFRHQMPVADLLLLRYDDIWLSQLLAIDERTLLLKFGNNCAKIIKDLLKKDSQLRNYYNRLIEKKGDEKILKEILSYLFTKYNKLFKSELVPQNKNKDFYIADIIQILASADA